MIHFFRKIRLKLLSQNRLSRYLIYAIGEIVLVVIGILIALQVNNWNIQRVNRKTEHKILLELKNEYTSNLLQLNEKKEIRTNLVMNSAKWLLERLEKPIADQNIDSVNHHLSRTMIVPSFDPVISVTNEIINSGKLQLIENQELRTHLTIWPSTTNDLVREEEQFITLMYESYYLFLVENYQLMPLVSLLQNDSAVHEIIRVRESSFSLFRNKEIQDIDQLFSNQDFEDYLSLILGFSNFLNNITTVLEEDNLKLIHLIEIEIEK
jgi:hypothetical protein